MGNVSHLQNFQVFEFRRYQIVEGERANFARCFDAWFPEAFQQLGAIAVGQFFDRDDPLGFTWIRGFKELDARATANASIYYGPIWKEHAAVMNARLTEDTNVLLLQLLEPNRGITVLPAVDPVSEPDGARGVAVAQIFAIEPDGLAAVTPIARAAFDRYDVGGVREAAVFVTLDAKNNFPQLPFRTDGPYLVWFGILENDETLERFRPLAAKIESELSATGSVRSAELLILDPTHRSRLRWL